jgi:ferredoxin
MSSDNKAMVDRSVCMSCGGCVGVCPFVALELENGMKLNPLLELCTGCGICERFCPVGAIKVG